MGDMSKRLRGQVAGGYVRKTLSLPASLVEQVERHLAAHPGMTMSVFMTVAAEREIKRRT